MTIITNYPRRPPACDLGQVMTCRFTRGRAARAALRNMGIAAAVLLADHAAVLHLIMHV